MIDKSTIDDLEFEIFKIADDWAQEIEEGDTDAAEVTRKQFRSVAQKFANYCASVARFKGKMKTLKSYIAEKYDEETVDEIFSDFLVEEDKEDNEETVEEEAPAETDTENPADNLDKRSEEVTNSINSIGAAIIELSKNKIATAILLKTFEDFASAKISLDTLKLVKKSIAEKGGNANF